jgi:hypothetical protein
MEIIANQIYVSRMDNMAPLVILAVIGKYIMFKPHKSRQHPQVYTKAFFKQAFIKDCKYKLKHFRHGTTH